MKINIKTLPHFEGLPLPQYKTKGSAGFDIRAAITLDRIMPIYQGNIYKIPTGLCFEIPEGFELQLRMRSGLALNDGLLMINAPATIDSDYRGEVFILVSCIKNPIAQSPVISRGDRIAQGIIAAVTQVSFNVVEYLSDTERGEGAFGSTGLS